MENPRLRSVIYSLRLIVLLERNAVRAIVKQEVRKEGGGAITLGVTCRQVTTAWWFECARHINHPAVRNLQADGNQVGKKSRMRNTSPPSLASSSLLPLTLPSLL